MSSAADDEELHGAIADRLAVLDQRYTGRRRTIVEALADAQRPLTVPEILGACPGLPQSSAYRSLMVLNEAGVICGPIYTIADIFEDPQYRARDMLIEHEDPEFGPYVGPGVVPKLTRTPGAVRWSAKWEEGSHNQEVYGALLGLGDDEIAELREEGVL